MHILTILIWGFVLLAACCAVGWWAAGAGGMARAGRNAFVPLWLVVSLVNMWVGVKVAGYGVGEEAAIFVLVFGLPAVLATMLTRCGFATSAGPRR